MKIVGSMLLLGVMLLPLVLMGSCSSYGEGDQGEFLVFPVAIIAMAVVAGVGLAVCGLEHILDQKASSIEEVARDPENMPDNLRSAINIWSLTHLPASVLLTLVLIGLALLYIYLGA